jgi:transposase InsO family protein
MKSLIQWVGIFGVPEEIRTNEGSQYTSSMAEDLRSLLQFKHITIVVYHPQANGKVERRNAEVMKMHRALVFER